MQIYVVQPQDTVDKIAAQFQIPADTIIYNNQLPYPYRLTVGQALLLSTDENRGITQTNRFVYTGGYAYPFISRWTLEQTLPYLSDLFIFSYGFTLSGELIPPLTDDTWMIPLAKAYGTRPILTLTPIDNTGRFNNYLISRVINSPAAVAALIGNITDEITNRGFEGVDIDFEYILATDRDAFVAFVEAVHTAVNALGYPVSVALAPKTSDEQRGLLYEGKDYERLGAVADYVLLMTYEWGYAYGPAMAVAPINKVRQVLDYAVSVIPPAKIHLGIPNYGYDWTLPFVQGYSKAVTLGNVEAVQLAVSQNVPIQFDEIAQSPYFFYTKDTVTHEVWFEDVRSLQAKFNLINEYGLRGMSYWNIMQYFRANWLLAADTFILS